jgi:histidine triad (HIT) family protein
LTPEDSQLLGKMVIVAKDLAFAANAAEDGYRLVLNCNENGGQEVYHIHLHLLAGRSMQWPPG